jgi:hypothetical protein
MQGGYEPMQVRLGVIRERLEEVRLYCWNDNAAGTRAIGGREVPVVEFTTWPCVRSRDMLIDERLNVVSISCPLRLQIVMLLRRFATPDSFPITRTPGLPRRHIVQPRSWRLCVGRPTSYRSWGRI